jgi:glyoxylase-like metal-dependent hydrolase (beta-lactamase superfamily II)
MMKRTAILATIVLAGVGIVGVAAQQPPPPPGPGAGGRPILPPPGKIEKVRDNLYKIFGGGGNTTVFVTDAGVVLVDTKLPNNGEAILNQVRTVTDKPVTMIINTHVHPDHNGSNDYFKSSRPTVEIVAHENTAKWVAANPRANPAMKPDRTFASKLSLGSGKDRIDLYYFGAAHTNGDAFVVFPAARTVAVGDVMAWKMAPLIDPGSGGSAIALPDTLEKAVKGLKNIDLVIEGHGDVDPWSELVRDTKFNRALTTAARAAYTKGEAPAAAVAALQKNPRFAAYLGTKLLEGLEYGNTPVKRAHMNVNVIYQELSGEKVTTNFGAPLPATPKHKASDPQDTAAAPPPQ